MNKFESMKVIVDRGNWLRTREDFTEPTLGLDGEEAQEGIYLSIDKAACIMGTLMSEVRGIPLETMKGVKYPSDLGINDFMLPVASALGGVVPMEREIARITDRKGPYREMSEKEIEARLAGLVSTLGYNVEFGNGG